MGGSEGEGVDFLRGLVLNVIRGIVYDRNVSLGYSIGIRIYKGLGDGSGLGVGGWRKERCGCRG